MFDLEQTIAEWRRRMAAGGIRSEEVLDELESHLREDIQVQMQSGAGAEAAFAAAVERLGLPAVLRREFAKSETAKFARRQKLKRTILRLIGVGVALPEAFTLNGQRALELGGNQARAFGHDFVGTEHVLLGLLEVETGVVHKLLRRAGIDVNRVRGEIHKLVGPGAARQQTSVLPYTPRVQKALMLAGKEAKTKRHSRVGVEHIFLGLMLEGSGVAAKVLTNLGLSAETARRELLKEMGTA